VPYSQENPGSSYVADDKKSDADSVFASLPPFMVNAYN
jgi:hypothetical protein